MKKRKMNQFLYYIIIVGVFGCILGVFIFIFLDMYRQRACFAQFQRIVFYKIFEEINDELYPTDNPLLLEETMRDFLDEHPHFEPYLNGNYSLNVGDLLPDKNYVFQVGNYLYFPYDSNGKRIQWSNEKNRYHIILVDSKPLWNRNFLVQYAGAGGSYPPKLCMVET